MRELIFATRPSQLARWQTHWVQEQLQQTWRGLVCRIEVIRTSGDRELDRPLPEIGGKGLFTHELEEALLQGRVDAAVHSLKDLPVEEKPGLITGLIPEREDRRDVLITRNGETLQALPFGAVIGTSSIRRQAQLLAYRPDLKIRPVRGNVETRVKKVLAGEYDAIILAAAGIKRLGMTAVISEYLSYDVMLPAPGQGALAVQCRSDNDETLRFLGKLESKQARAEVMAERAFLSGLGGGCSLPVAARAVYEADERVFLQGLIASPDGRQVIRVSGRGRDPTSLGNELANQALTEGAARLLEAIWS